MDKPKINHLAVWGMAILVQPLPMLWYNNIMFGIRWMELNGLKEDDFTDAGMLNLIWAFAAAVGMGYLFAHLFRAMNINKAVDALKWAFAMWLVLLFLELATQNAFTLRAFELTLLDTIIVLFKYEIMAIAIVLWKKKEKMTQESLA